MDVFTRLLGGSAFRRKGREESSDPLAEPTFRFEGSDPARIYGRFAYRSETSVGSIPRPEKIEAVGDWLILDELVGSEALYVRVGDLGNPWMRLEEGDVIKRRFDQLWVTTGAAPDAAITGLTRVQTEASFIFGWGEIKRKGKKTYAFRRGFKAFRSTASSVEQSLFKPLVDLCPGAPLVFGKRGGTVIIRNRDAGNTLLLRYGTVGAPGSEDAWELYPGETLSLGVASRIHSSGDTIVAYTPGGSCRYGFMVSAFDIDRADLNQTLLSGI